MIFGFGQFVREPNITPPQIAVATLAWTGLIGAASFLAYRNHLMCLEAVKSRPDCQELRSLQDQHCYCLLEGEVRQGAAMAAALIVYSLGVAAIGSLVSEPVYPLPRLNF